MARPMIVPGADLTFPRAVLASFLRAVALTRAINVEDAHQLIWRVVRGSAFDTAIVNWCILFGSDDRGRQHLHWKQLFDEAAFRAGLLAALEMDLDEWSAYRTTLVDYRNELAAHRDLNPRTTHYPNLDIALKAANFYHSQLRQKAEVEGVNMVGPTLLEHYEECLVEFSAQLAVAIEAVGK